MNNRVIFKERSPWIKLKETKLVKSIYTYNSLYVLLILSIAYVVVFNIIPTVNQIYYSFVKFDLFGDNKFVGFEIFKEVLQSDDFQRAFLNTVVIGLCMIVFYFPIPIILALMLNEMTSFKFKRIAQTVIIIPHFISWVVVAGLFVMILSPVNGPVNELIKFLGGDSINFMTDAQWFRGVVVASSIWKYMGYGTIVYLASISSINPILYEAAIVDGAKKMRQIWHITLPGLRETILIVFLLQISNMFLIFEQILIMYSPLVYSTGDVLGTYSYRMGLVYFKFSQATVVTLVGSVISFVIFEIYNFVTKKTTGRYLM